MGGEIGGHRRSVRHPPAMSKPSNSPTPTPPTTAAPNAVASSTRLRRQTGTPQMSAKMRSSGVELARADRVDPVDRPAVLRAVLGKGEQPGVQLNATPSTTLWSGAPGRVRASPANTARALGFQYASARRAGAAGSTARPRRPAPARSRRAAAGSRWYPGGQRLHDPLQRRAAGLHGGRRHVAPGTTWLNVMVRINGCAAGVGGQGHPGRGAEVGVGAVRGVHDPGAERPIGPSPPPSTTGVPSSSPVRAAAGASPAHHRGGGHHLGEQRAVQPAAAISSSDQLPAPGRRRWCCSHRTGR